MAISNAVSVRLPDALLERLTARATAEDKKVSDLVRELIANGLSETGNVQSTYIVERIDKLEAEIKRLLGVEDANVMTRIDSVNADFWLANEALIGLINKSIQAGAEARYFAHLSAMYGIDIAHFVAQKTESGATPKPQDKDEKSKQMEFHDMKCKEFAAGFRLDG